MRKKRELFPFANGHPTVRVDLHKRSKMQRDTDEEFFARVLKAGAAGLSVMPKFFKTRRGIMVSEMADKYEIFCVHYLENCRIVHRDFIQAHFEGRMTEGSPIGNHLQPSEYERIKSALCVLKLISPLDIEPKSALESVS